MGLGRCSRQQSGPRSVNRQEFRVCQAYGMVRVALMSKAEEFALKIDVHTVCSDPVWVCSCV